MWCRPVCLVGDESAELLVVVVLYASMLWEGDQVLEGERARAQWSGVGNRGRESGARGKGGQLKSSLSTDCRCCCCAGR